MASSRTRLAPAGVVVWCGLVVLATAWAGRGDAIVATPAAAASRAQGPMSQGAKVTFRHLRERTAVHSQRARLLSLAVERDELATPFLAEGPFSATFATVVTLPARDRVDFRIEGRGKVTLKINGKVVLDGRLSSRRPLETDKTVRMNKGENDLELVFESGPRGDGQMRLLWSGYDFGFEPIAPERLSYPATDDDVVRGEQLRHGFALFAERRCARCHDFEQLRIAESAFRELDRSGPDLRRVGARVRPAFLVEWLRSPHEVRPDATMPTFALSDEELRDVALWLSQQGAPLPRPPFADDAAGKGAVRFRELGCVACHVGPGEPAATHGVGERIPLSFVPAKWRPAALVAYLENPSEHYPDVRMPSLKLDVADAERLAAYLLGTPPADAPLPRGDADRGRRLVQKHGCVLCHALPGEIPPADRVFPRLRNLKAQRGCLAADAGARGDAPDHHLDDDERAALRAFLPFAETVPFRRAPMDYVARHLEAERCVSCHALDGKPSVWSRLVDHWSQQAPLPKEQNPFEQGLPTLTWAGAKLQPSWLSAFIRGERPSPRPWLRARMPAFAAHGATLAQGLLREHGYDDQDERLAPGGDALAVHGARLLQLGAGFGCVQCHAVGDKPATEVFEQEGVNLVTARKRLRSDYFMRWMMDPQRIDPGSRMPKYAADGRKTGQLDVLDGDARKQFEAIWQHLGGLVR